MRLKPLGHLSLATCGQCRCTAPERGRKVPKFSVETWYKQQFPQRSVRRALAPQVREEARAHCGGIAVDGEEVHELREGCFRRHVAAGDDADVEEHVAGGVPLGVDAAVAALGDVDYGDAPVVRRGEEVPERGRGGGIA